MAHDKRLGGRRILSILSTTQEEGRYLLTRVEGGSLENKVRILHPGVTSFIHMCD
jgi:hypothetical protein